MNHDSIRAVAYSKYFNDVKKKPVKKNFLTPFLQHKIKQKLRIRSVSWNSTLFQIAYHAI